MLRASSTLLRQFLPFSCTSANLSHLAELSNAWFLDLLFRFVSAHKYFPFWPHWHKLRSHACTICASHLSQSLTINQWWCTVGTELHSDTASRDVMLYDRQGLCALSPFLSHYHSLLSPSFFPFLHLLCSPWKQDKYCMLEMFLC